MDRNNTDTDRGQVGIGTLIVFIAMVLVAAIAAGVLINTAGFLQNQAEDTGTESTEQVADNLNVITEVGEVGQDSGDSSTDQIHELRVGVQPAAGADDINLAELSLQYVSDDDFGNLVVGNDGGGSQAAGDTDPTNIVLSDNGYDGGATTGPAEPEYLVDVITAENSGDIVMTDNADRYEIVIPLGTGSDAVSDDGDDSQFTNGDLDALSEGSEVEITITTEVGAQTVAFLQVPDSLSGDDAGTSVNL